MDAKIQYCSRHFLDTISFETLGTRSIESQFRLGVNRNSEDNFIAEQTGSNGFSKILFTADPTSFSPIKYTPLNGNDSNKRQKQEHKLNHIRCGGTKWGVSYNARIHPVYSVEGYTLGYVGNLESYHTHRIHNDQYIFMMQRTTNINSHGVVFDRTVACDSKEDYCEFNIYDITNDQWLFAKDDVMKWGRNIINYDYGARSLFITDEILVVSSYRQVKFYLIKKLNDGEKNNKYNKRISFAKPVLLDTYLIAPRESWMAFGTRYCKHGMCCIDLSVKRNLPSGRERNYNGNYTSNDGRGYNKATEDQKDSPKEAKNRRKLIVVTENVKKRSDNYDELYEFKIVLFGGDDCYSGRFLSSFLLLDISMRINMKNIQDREITVKQSNIEGFNVNFIDDFGGGGSLKMKRARFDPDYKHSKLTKLKAIQNGLINRSWFDFSYDCIFNGLNEPVIVVIGGHRAFLDGEYVAHRYYRGLCLINIATRRVTIKKHVKYFMNEFLFLCEKK